VDFVPLISVSGTNVYKIKNGKSTLAAKADRVLEIVDGVLRERSTASLLQ
jgi:hypothetical protein